MDSTNTEKAVFGTGCFWCTEAIYQKIKGVIRVTPGYAGGKRPNPSYEQVSTGATGHAEVVEIIFNPEVISYEKLLEIFWRIHDPTTMNRQGNDVGTQYRSVIFYFNEQQRQLAEESKLEVESEHIYENQIVTEIIPFTNFFEAEAYHHNYFENNPSQGYCQIIISPKLAKFRKEFKGLISN